MKGQLFVARSVVLLSMVILLAQPWFRDAFGSSGSRPALAADALDAANQYLTFIEAQYDGIGPGGGSVAVSPDGDHVYVLRSRTVTDSGTLAVFSRDAFTGALTFVEIQWDDVGGVDGLGGGGSVVVSPDGSHVYVAGGGEDAVAVFGRDGSTGALTFVEAQWDGVGGVDGLYGASAVAVSPDGNHVYVTGVFDDAVAVFGRNSVSGALTFVEMQQDGVGGADGLEGAHSVAVSSDGGHVYVASGADDAVAVFSRDGTSGTLSFVEVQRDGIGGVDGLDGADSVTVSPDGGHIYVAGSYDDAVAVFSRDATSGALTFVERQRDNVGGVDGLEGAESVIVSPDGGHVYVASGVDDAVAVFSRDASSGALTFVEVQQDGVGGVDGLDGARAVDVSPDSTHVYVASWDDDALAVFDRDASTGALTFIEWHRDNVGGVDGLGGAVSVTVSPDGGHVYVTGWFDDAVAVFGRGASTGALTFVEAQRDDIGGVDGLKWAHSVAVSPDGNHVYVAGMGDDAVVVFGRDGTTGALTFVEMQQDGVGSVNGLAGARAVAVSPDGSHVYVTGWDDDALAVFGRDLSTGALTFIEWHRDNVGGAACMEKPRSVAVSPDGGHVYVASTGDDSVQVFSRDGATGALTPSQCKVDGVGGVNGLDGASSVAVSADGNHVYATGREDDAVAVFGRDASTGDLTFLQVKRDGWGGVDGLDLAEEAAISPDGTRVYVTGGSDDAVAVFSRDASSGALTFVEMQQDNVGGVHGLDGAEGVTVSPDGNHVYVTSEWDDAVVVFGMPTVHSVYLPLVTRH